MQAKLMSLFSLCSSFSNVLFRFPVIEWRREYLGRYLEEIFWGVCHIIQSLNIHCCCPLFFLKNVCVYGRAAVIEMHHREIAILAIQSKVDETDVMFCFGA